ncbi:MAG: hypothetical protein KatS3mg126_1949 [Lysobacteraceae bacterium]|nr:MAG: hypothetical protein KatS3mg126_1949 [Xanthomonadaceae bacterium]
MPTPAGYAAAMARRKPAARKPARRAPRDGDGKDAPASGSSRPAARPRKRAAPAARKAAPAKRPAPKAARKPVSESQRERAFNLLVQGACLRAGTAAAIATLTRRVPLLGRLAPVLLGSIGETVALSRIQEQLVREVIALYEVELNEPEERGVILLATAAHVGARELSRATVDQLVRQLGRVLYRPVLTRVLPLAAIATEIAAAVASTYAVGKRAQALCRLPGTGARDLADLLRGLSGIDQSQLFKWSAEALGHALKPFRGAFSALLPGRG